MFCPQDEQVSDSVYQGIMFITDLPSFSEVPVTQGMTMLLHFIISSSLSALDLLQVLTKVQFGYPRFKVLTSCDSVLSSPPLT